MILERIYDLAEPRLKERKIKDVRVGLHLMSVELDTGEIGVTYVLRKELGDICMPFRQVGGLVGMPAREVAEWSLERKNVISTSLGLAVLNSAAEFDKLKQVNNPQGVDAAFSVEIRDTDNIGIIGHIGPIINRLRDKKDRMFVFERGDNVNGQVYPESEEQKLLPKCQVVFITSSTLINGTLENVLNYCSSAREVVMVGSTTPLYPEAFTASGVTVLSGTRWLTSNKDSIFENISQCAGMKQLIKYGQKVSVRISRDS